MSGNVTGNQSPIIKAQVYSEFMLEQLHAGFLPDNLYRNVSDFGDGDTLYIPVLGETVIRDYVEDTGVTFDAIDTGQVTLTISDYVSGASYVTDKLKEDAYKAAFLEAAIPREHLRLIKERFESDLLAQVNKQTLADPNAINGFSHRWVAASGTTDGVLTLDDILYAKLVLDEVHATEQGRLLIVPPIVEASINKQVAGQAYTNNPMFEGIVTTGMAASMRFIRNIFGFDIWVSTRCPLQTASETIVGGPQAASDVLATSRVCTFGVFGDEMNTPIMGAWRQSPKVEGDRNVTFKRDEYSTTARWGLGLQRRDTIGGILVSPTLYV